MIRVTYPATRVYAFGSRIDAPDIGQEVAALDHQDRNGRRAWSTSSNFTGASFPKTDS
jgi:hypothetical protein